MFVNCNWVTVLCPYDHSVTIMKLILPLVCEKRIRDEECLTTVSPQPLSTFVPNRDKPVEKQI